MPGARKVIPKGETNNCYGDSARSVEINALGAHETFVRALGNDFPKDEVCINGMSVYTIKHKPLKPGHT